QRPPNLRRLFGPLTSEIIGKSNRINWPIDLRYRQITQNKVINTLYLDKNPVNSSILNSI
ncbi:hypothetical protein, partial [Sphingobacterium multivorum]|uniref:hypothetical protein n=1 Tax=Sphingobacterium multivorum TaxID=28454 RepID=UPI003DA2C363